MKKELDIYNISIDEAENIIMDCVSIVERPAIERSFLAFNKQSQSIKNIAFSGDEKMQLLGLALVPDLPIYRKDEDGYEYYVQFSVEEIEKMVKVFMKNGLTKSMNIEHDPNKKADSFIFQSFITSDKIKAPAELGEVPNGSWIIGVQVQSTDLWQKIKTGEVNGFSIEGLFNLLLSEEKVQEVEIDITGWMQDEEISDEEFFALVNQIEYYLNRI